MKVFISSLITGMEKPRSVASASIENLGYKAIMAENFPALASSPRIACLEALRDSDAVVLILEEGYGAKQDTSGRSATHEEWLEAKEKCLPTFVFIKQDAKFDLEQTNFVKAVQNWSSGDYTAYYESNEALGNKITRALHEFKTREMPPPLESGFILKKAVQAIPLGDQWRGQSTSSVIISISGDYAKPIIRPSELESSLFKDDIIQKLKYGEVRLFSDSSGMSFSTKATALILQQDKTMFSINENADLIIEIPLDREGSFAFAIIKEKVEQIVFKALKIVSLVLELVDSTNNISNVAVACHILCPQYTTMRTASEHSSQPNSMSNGFQNTERSPVHLPNQPTSRMRLKVEAKDIAADLTVLLHREFYKQ